MKRTNFPRRKVKRQEEATLRAETRTKRSVSAQLKILDEKYGKDSGAKKERQKLISQINK